MNGWKNNSVGFECQLIESKFRLPAATAFNLARPRRLRSQMHPAKGTSKIKVFALQGPSRYENSFAASTTFSGMASEFASQHPLRENGEERFNLH